MLPEPIKDFANKFSRLPAIGPRLAARLGLFLASLEEDEFEKLSEALKGLRKTDRCAQCLALKLKGNNLCTICSDQNRNQKIIAIVEKETDIDSIEKSGAFRGLYLVVGEAPHNGVLPEKQKEILREFKSAIREKKREVEEVIIALPHNAFGDFLSSTIEQGLSGTVKKITRLSRGIPTGGAIEFADEETLKSAIEKRG